jgi:hypothetical protein
MHGNLPLIGVPPLALLCPPPRMVLPQWWIPSKLRQVTCLANGDARAMAGGLLHLYPLTPWRPRKLFATTIQP